MCALPVKQVLREARQQPHHDGLGHVQVRRQVGGSVVVGVGEEDRGGPCRVGVEQDVARVELTAILRDKQHQEGNGFCP